MKRKLRNFSLPLILISLSLSCTYHAGNVGSICGMKSGINGYLIEQLRDSLENKYYVPGNVTDYISSSTVSQLGLEAFYFSDSPKEIYFISLSSYPSLRYLYDCENNILKNREDLSFTEAEKKRIKFRYKNTILKDIVRKAKELEISDCEIYYYNLFLHDDLYGQPNPSELETLIRNSLASKFKRRCDFLSNFEKVKSICTVPTRLNLLEVNQLMESISKKYELPTDMVKMFHFPSSLDIKQTEVSKKNIYFFYFNSPPEEVYSFLINDNISIHHIYNFEKDEVKYQSKIFPEEEKTRIRTRFKNTVLKDIELKAKELGIPDSVLYFQDEGIPDSIIQEFKMRKNKKN